MSTSGSPARTASASTTSSLEQVEAMARLACQSGLVVHAVVPRATGVVERARAVAGELGLDCYADVRARSIRVRFKP